MGKLINKNLITLKCVIFCFISGVGCLLPFLPLHMLSIGLDKGEARVVSIVAPCVALLGPAILGPLIDKLSVGRGSTGGGTGPSGSGRLLRVLTALCLVLSAVFYTLLLAVPYTERHEARRPEVYFMCDANGAYVSQEVCTEGMRCNRWEGKKTGVLAVGQCEYGCADQNRTWLTSSFPTTTTTTTISPYYNSVDNATEKPEESQTDDEDHEDFEAEILPPHLCSDGQCLVYMRHAARMRVPLALYTSDPDDSYNDTDEGWCEYHSGPEEYNCVVPEEHVPLGFQHMYDCVAAVRCQVLDPYDEPDGVLANAECRRVIGDPDSTFWIYFIIRILADIWPTAGLALLGAACVIATRETSLGRGDVGRQLAWGALGLAVVPPLAGMAVDSMGQESQPMPYLVPLLLHAIFMLMGALILLCDTHMPLSTPEWWWHTSTGVLALPMSAVRRYGAETAALAALMALLGVLWSGIDSYLPWTVSELNGTHIQMGLTLTVGAAPALPALWWAERLVDYIGHTNIFISALLFYAVRYTGLAYTESYTWVAVTEALEVFTLSLVWVAAVLYFRHLVPRKYTVTGQAMPVIAHFCIGRCIGSALSGLASLQSSLESARDVYKALALVSLAAGALCLPLYHLVLAPTCAAPPAPPPPALLQGMNANGGSNGTYSPMRVYHEERSKKGQFRY